MVQNFNKFSLLQDFIARAYMYLVERLHMVLNSTMENQFFTETLEQENLKSLYLYAEEAYMLGNIDEARYYYLTVCIFSV